MDETVQLPGGFLVGDEFVREVELREMSGEEEEIIVDRRKADGGKGKSLKSPNDRLSEILARCTVRIGSVVCEANRKPETASQKAFWDLWHNAFTGDRGVAIVRLRQLSLGDKYVFPETCPRCNYEMRRVVYDLSDAHVAPYFKWIERELSEDVDEEEDPEKFKELAEERRILLLQQENHEVKLPSGKQVVYKLFRRKDEDRVMDATEKKMEAILSALIAAHIVSIDGALVNSLKDKGIKFMSTRDRDFLRQHFDEAEGGLDTWMEVHCDNDQCGHVFNRKLDVGKPGFFIRLGT